MTFSEYVLQWPPPGTGTLLLLLGALGGLGLESLVRAARFLDGLPAVLVARILTLFVLFSGVVVLAGNNLSPAGFGLVMSGVAVLALASADALRAVSAAAVLAISGRVRIGDRVRVDDVDGVVAGFHLGWLDLRTAEGLRTVGARSRIDRTGAAVGELQAPADAVCALGLVMEGADPGVEETVRRVVLCSPYVAMTHRPEVVCTWQGETCAVRVRAWALTEAHVDRFVSDVKSRCFALGFRELTW